MTWPQYLRHQCRVDGRLIKMKGRLEPAIVFLLLVRGAGHLVPYVDVCEHLWPDPDLQPLDWHNALSVFLRRLRTRGLPIETRISIGLIMLQEPEPTQLSGDGRVNLPELGVGDDQLTCGDLDAALPR
jgi:hypothetical protein